MNIYTLPCGCKHQHDPETDDVLVRASRHCNQTKVLLIDRIGRIEASKEISKSQRRDRSYDSRR